MVIDTSALIGILLKEPGHEALGRALVGAPERAISPVSLLEAVMVLKGRKGEVGLRELDWFLLRSKMTVVPLDLAQVEYARHGWMLYGKGNHPAALNLGDCCTYALVKASRRRLLCKGNDFAQTDISGQIVPLEDHA
jgi:ribonuclease VapC